jgi:hypothetical protein
MSKVVDLVDSETPDGIVLQSYMSEDCVSIGFGLTTIDIPISEWVSFASFIANTAIKKHAIDELSDTGRS